MDGDRRPARSAAMGLLVHGGRRQGARSEQRGDATRRIALRQPADDLGARVRVVGLQRRAARHCAGCLVSVADAEAGQPADDGLHAAGLRDEHPEVPGAVPAAWRGRRRGRVADDGPRQHHHGQPHRGRQSEADDRRHAQRQRDADGVAGLRVRSDAGAAVGQAPAPPPVQAAQAAPGGRGRLADAAARRSPTPARIRRASSRT